jgi:hypothetical protein
MKRLNAVLIFGLLIVSFCFAQIQPGDASYNEMKAGFTINHASLSFNTRVKVTNLRNNRSVEAVVNGRIPIVAGWIADVSRDVGDALEMDKTGMTLVQLEVLPGRGVETARPENSGDTAPDSVPQQAAPSITQILPLQTIPDLQYVPVPTAPTQPCCNALLLWVIFFLLLLVIAILVVFLILMRHRLPLWPWYYPLWIRRRRQYLKKTRKRFQ